MKIRILAFFTFGLLAAGCSSRPEDMIVGTWEFDHVEPIASGMNSPTSATYVESVNKQLQGIETEFFEDGTCISIIPTQRDPVHGNYRFEDNYSTLITSYTTAPQDNPSKILKLTGSEMVLQTNDLIYYMTK